MIEIPEVLTDEQMAAGMAAAGQGAEVGSQRSEVGGQRAPDVLTDEQMAAGLAGGQRSEVRDQRSEGGEQEAPNVLTDEQMAAGGTAAAHEGVFAQAGIGIRKSAQELAALVPGAKAKYQQGQAALKTDELASLQGNLQSALALKRKGISPTAANVEAQPGFFESIFGDPTDRIRAAQSTPWKAGTDDAYIAGLESKIKAVQAARDAEAAAAAGNRDLAMTVMKQAAAAAGPDPTTRWDKVGRFAGQDVAGTGLKFGAIAPLGMAGATTLMTVEEAARAGMEERKVNLAESLAAATGMKLAGRAGIFPGKGGSAARQLARQVGNLPTKSAAVMAPVAATRAIQTGEIPSVEELGKEYLTTLAMVGGLEVPGMGKLAVKAGAQTARKAYAAPAIMEQRLAGTLKSALGDNLRVAKTEAGTEFTVTGPDGTVSMVWETTNRPLEVRTPEQARKALDTVIATGGADGARAKELLQQHNGDAQAAWGELNQRGEFEIPGVTHENTLSILDPVTGRRIQPAAIVQLVVGAGPGAKATRGTVWHEALHALAIISGMRTRNGSIQDPKTGKWYKDETLAVALEGAIDHPLTQRLREGGMRLLNIFRRNPQETLGTVARRMLKEMQAARQGAKAPRSREEGAPEWTETTTPEQRAAGELEWQTRLAAIDKRMVDRAAEGNTITGGPAMIEGKPASSTALLDQFGRPIEGTEGTGPVRAGKEQPTHFLTTPRYETTVGVVPDYVEATDPRLRTSYDQGYPDAMQPRNRNTATSAAQIEEIAGHPDPARLLRGTTTDFGPPLVDADGNVVSGNGRTQGLRVAYERGTAAEYQKSVVDQAQTEGRPDVALMKRPVKIWRLVDSNGHPVNQVAEWSNRDPKLERTPTEIALADARTIKDKRMMSLWAPDESGNIRAASNQEFLKAFILANRGAGGEAYLNPDGTISADITQRVNRAMLAAALGDTPLGRKILSDAAANAEKLGAQRIIDGVTQAASGLAAVAEIKPKLNLAPELSEALRVVLDYRTQKAAGKVSTPAQYFGQEVMQFAGDTPIARDLARRMIDLDSTKQVRELLTRYVDAAEKADAGAGMNMFGDAETTKEQLLTLAMGQKTDGAGRKAEVGKKTVKAKVPTPEKPKGPWVFMPGVGGATPPATPEARLDVLDRIGVDKTLNTEVNEKKINKAHPSFWSQVKQWAQSIPHFQGSKNEMAPPSALAVMKAMPEPARARITTIYDLFGGGGGWGLFNAMTLFKSARRLVVGEFKPARMEKIKIFHTQGNRMAELIDGDNVIQAQVKAAIKYMYQEGVYSGSVVGRQLTIKNVTAEQSGVLMALIDAALSPARGSKTDKHQHVTPEAAWEAIRELVIKDAANVYKAAQEFKKRGGLIEYTEPGDSYALEIESGPHVLAIIDPPYYKTTGYDGSIVGLDKFTQTTSLIERLRKAHNAVIYTDNAGWHDEAFKTIHKERGELGVDVSNADVELLQRQFNVLDYLDVVQKNIARTRREILGVGYDRTETDRAGTVAHAAAFSDANGRMPERRIPAGGVGGNHDQGQNPIREMAGGNAGQAREMEGPGAIPVGATAEGAAKTTAAESNGKLNFNVRRVSGDAARFNNENRPFEKWRRFGEVAIGYRSGEYGRGGGNSEGDGRYIAMTREDASVFGEPRAVRFTMPRRPLIIDEEPLYLLHESNEIEQPPKAGDSEQLRLVKQATKNVLERSGWNSEAVGSEFTRLAQAEGYDGVRVRSGGMEWVVVFENAPKTTAPDGSMYSVRRVAGRPDMSQISPDKRVRSIVMSVDELRNQAGLPEAQTMQEWATTAAQRMADNPSRAREDVLTGRMSYEGDDAGANTILARKVITELGVKAFESGLPDEYGKVGAAIWNYRNARSNLARAMRAGVDDLETPAERNKRWVLEELFAPSAKLDKALEAMPPAERIRAIAKEALGLDLQIMELEGSPIEQPPASRDLQGEQAGPTTPGAGATPISQANPTPPAQRAPEGRSAAIPETQTPVQQVMRTLLEQGIDLGTMTEAEWGDPHISAEIARVIQGTKSTRGERIYEYWRNSILSGLGTHLANVIGNIGSGLYEYGARRPVEALLNIVARNPDAMRMSELPGMYKALFSHISESAKTAVTAFSTEMPSVSGARIEDLKVAIPGRLGRTIRIPQRSLLAADEFAKSMIVNAELWLRATRQAKSEGAEDVEARTAEILQNPQAELYMRAKIMQEIRAEARRLTFQEPGELSADLIRARNRGGLGWVLKFALPFVITPLNIAKIGVRQSPLGAFAMAARATKGAYAGQPGRARLLRDASEQILAAAATMAFIGLVTDDDDNGQPRITGSMRNYKHAGQKDFARRQGQPPPQSIRLGGRWYSYARVEPFATTTTLVVDALNAIRNTENEDVSDRAGRFWSSMKALVRDKTFLQGIGDIVRAVEDDSKGISLAQRFPSSFVPNIALSLMRATDPMQRDQRVRRRDDRSTAAELTIGVGRQAIPVAALQNPPRRDIWGRPETKTTGFGPATDFLWRAIVPIKTQRVTSPVNFDRMLVNYNRQARNRGWDQFWPAMPDNSVEMPGRPGTERTAYMTPTEYDAFLLRRAELFMDAARKRKWNFDQPQLRDRDQFDAIMRGVTEAAKNEFIRSRLAAPVTSKLRASGRQP